MKLTHPNSKTVVETDNPEAYLSQGWTTTPATETPEKTDDKK